MTYETKRSVREWLKIISPILSALAICVTVTIKMAEGIKVVVTHSEAIIYLNAKASNMQVDIDILKGNESGLDKRVTRLEALIEKK